MFKKILSAVLGAAMLLSVSTSVIPAVAEEVPTFPMKDGAFAVYDSELGYFKGIYPATTVTALRSEFDAEIEVKNTAGTVCADSATIGSDYTVSVSGVDGAFKCLVYGDCDRDGGVTVGDAIEILKVIAEWNVDVCEPAADVDRDGKFTIADAILVLKSVAGWNVTLGYAPFRVETDRITAPSEDETLALTFGSNTERLNTEADTANGTYTYVMELAKNEAEFCQAYLASKNGHAGLTITLSDFVNADGDVLESELCREEYYTVLYTKNDVLPEGEVHSVVPDSLPPATGTFKIAADRQQGFFIRVRSAKEQASGLYRAVLEVKDADGRCVKTAYVYANVWNFALADESACKTAFGMGAEIIYQAHRVATDPEKSSEYYKKYYEYFLDNRINIWTMPCDPVTDEADVYLNDPRVNTFLVAGGYGGGPYGGGKGGWDSDPDRIRAAYEKLSANENWAKKAMFYIDDEPMEMGKVNSVISTYGKVNELYPGARIVVPQHVDYFLEQLGGEDIMSIVTKYSTLLCPHETFFIDPTGPNAREHLYTTAAVEKYGSLVDRMDALRAEGKETWWYTSDTPRDNMPNILSSNTAMECRTLFWAQYSYDMDGMLFWATTEWINGANALRNRRLQRSVGLLVYPGAEYGVDGPVSCIRTEIARDGIEDFEYLTMIEERYGAERAKEFCGRIVTSVEEFSTDGEALRSVRREMAKLLEEAEA